MNSSPRLSRRPRLPPPRPHGARLDRRHGRDRSASAPRSPASTTPTTTRRAPSPRRPSDLTKQRFGGYSGQEIYVVWKDPAGATSPAAKQRLERLLRAGASKVEHIAPHTPIRVSRRRQIGDDHAADDRPRLGRHEGAGQAADRRRRDQQRRRPLRSSSAAIRSTQAQGSIEPRGHRLPRRRDRAADRLRLGRRRRPAARRSRWSASASPRAA